MTASLGPSFFFCKRGINTYRHPLSIHHSSTSWSFLPTDLMHFTSITPWLDDPSPQTLRSWFCLGLTMPSSGHTSKHLISLYFKKYLFIYLYLAALDLVAPQGSFTVSCGISPHGPRVLVLSSSGSLALLPRGMWDLSTLTRDRTCVPCIARRILNHQIRY